MLLFHAWSFKTLVYLGKAAFLVHKGDEVHWLLGQKVENVLIIHKLDVMPRYPLLTVLFLEIDIINGI